MLGGQSWPAIARDRPTSLDTSWNAPGAPQPRRLAGWPPRVQTDDGVPFNQSKADDLTEWDIEVAVAEMMNQIGEDPDKNPQMAKNLAVVLRRSPKL